MADARKSIPDFRRFIDGVNDARPEQYLEQPHSAITGEEAFRRVQAYMRDYYAGVEPVHTFLDANGSVFDCIPIEQQYSLRGHKGRLPKPSELPPGLARPSDDMSKRVIQLHENFIDRLGNKMYCPEGAIPVQRLTLPWLCRFPELPAFLRKHYPWKHPLLPPRSFFYNPLVPQYHQYAVAQQVIGNIGGGAILNVWDPVPTWWPQMMSLSQIWIANDDHKQTVEAGWQVNPYRYPHTKPVLFCYWSTYDAGHCYNLLCPGFVQTDNSWMLGGALPAWSSPGGTQIELAIAYHLEVDKWWLIVDGTRVGYYPTSLFQIDLAPGQTVAPGETLEAGAALIMVGGETATATVTSWPPMGSGQFAAEQYGQVAYSKQIQYLTQAGVNDANLTLLSNGHPECYTAIKASYGVTLDPNTLAPWGTTLWFGGTPPTGCNCL